MSSLSKKILTLCFLTVVPLLVIVFKFFVFTRRGLAVPEIQLQTVFWIVRAGLAPFIIVYAVRFWTEVNRITLLFSRQSIGLFSYFLLHWGLSFLICKTFYEDPRNWNLFNTIKNESLILNLFCYIASVAIFYLWVYFERYTEAVKQSTHYEQALASSKIELLKQHDSIPVKSGPQKVDRLTVKTGSKLVVIPVEKILYFQSDGPYIKIITDEKVHLLNLPLYELQEMLPEPFLRIHRSSIVNTAFIKHVRSLQNGDYLLELQNGSELRASRTYRESLRAALGQL